VIALLQHKQGVGNTVTSFGIAFTSDVTKGSLLVCSSYITDTSGPTSVTDTLTQTYVPDVRQDQVQNGNEVSIWSTPNSVAGANTLTTTTSAAFVHRNTILEYSGMATSTPKDQSNSADNAAATSLASGDITTTQADEVLICLFASGAADTYTADGAFTVEETILAGAGVNRAQTSDRVVSAIGTYSNTSSIAGAAKNLSSCIVSYKALEVFRPQSLFQILVAA
jgi:hypothetical protein